MKAFKKIKFKLGGRIFKTGLSVFLTALICLYFNLPAIFAVITAIVSTEPTASDSIKKGLIRFPASAIGAAISLSFTYLLGESALTYSLAAMLTIIFCYQLKLNDGILVATLTAVAMIPVTNDHFLLAFITRLGTTTIGIVVSTLVNLLILPPDYSPTIHRKLNELYCLFSQVLELTIDQILDPKHKQTNDHKNLYTKLNKELDQTNKLIEFQRMEFKFHKSKVNDVRKFHYAVKHLNILQQLTYHLGNLQFIHINESEFTYEEKSIIRKATTSLSKILNDNKHCITNEHYHIIEALDHQFWDWKDEENHQSYSTNHHHFASETIVLYELLSLHDVLEELEHLSHKDVVTAEN